MAPRVCVDRRLSDELLLRIAERSIDERVGNAPAGRRRWGGDRRDKLRMAIETGRAWSPGRTLRVRFLGGEPAVQQRVVAVAAEWMRHASIRFEVTDEPSAEIRVAFEGGASWSLVGTEALELSPDEATMNLGWLTPETSDEEYSRVVLHEFGHSLGCIHEHANPAGGIPWDRAAVYAYYARPPNGWLPEEVDRNIFETYDADKTQFSVFDRASIMLYPIDPALTAGRLEVGWNTALSETDRHFIGERYPLPDLSARELPWNGEPVGAAIAEPGAVERFRFEVGVPGDVVVETSGFTDVVMRLFGPKSKTVPLAEDDDGGLGANARIELPLMAGAHTIEVRHKRATGVGVFAVSLRTAGEAVSPARVR